PSRMQFTNAATAETCAVWNQRRDAVIPAQRAAVTLAIWRCRVHRVRERRRADRRLTTMGRKSGPNSSSRIVHRTLKRAPHESDEPAACPRPGRRSRTTIAAELQAELDGARVFQLFARKLGPNDVTYVSAMALDPRHRVVEVKATAMELGDAL